MKYTVTKVYTHQLDTLITFYMNPGLQICIIAKNMCW